MARKTFTANDSMTIDLDSLFNGGYSISATGSFGGGTLAITGSVDNTTFFPLGSTKFSDRSTTVTQITANDYLFGDAVGLRRIRVTLTGATSPSIDVSILAKTA